MRRDYQIIFILILNYCCFPRTFASFDIGYIQVIIIPALEANLLEEEERGIRTGSRLQLTSHNLGGFTLPELPLPYLSLLRLVRKNYRINSVESSFFCSDASPVSSKHSVISTLNSKLISQSERLRMGL
jgi:hypothetical protein